ncbi:hypothetical protein WK13_34670 [Burkholderia ubonensis]|uniref:hypothetical protein n=1 Tax=Burkholderia ubonensis TaxID=101571 RepID=UPI00075B0E3D|nr:hypothetical protein [Burkholderia ubonensis]KVR21684.1 hypothetical protein WK13_34670 [Burkholderia ubonensis]
MTDGQIDVLLMVMRSRTPVHWRDPNDGTVNLITRIDPEWVEFEDEPDLKEPAALLLSGKWIALRNVPASEFVTCSPLFLHTSD